MGSRDKVYIFDKEVRVLVVGKKTYVRQHTGRQQESPLNPVAVALKLAQGVSNDKVSDDAPEEKGEEVGTSGRVKVKGRQYKPKFCQIRKFEMVKNKIHNKRNRQKNQCKFVS